MHKDQRSIQESNVLRIQGTTELDCSPESAPQEAWPSQHLSSLHSEHTVCAECFKPRDIKESGMKDFSSNSRQLCGIDCRGLLIDFSPSEARTYIASLASNSLCS